MYDSNIKADSSRNHIEMAKEVAFKIFQDFNPDQQLEFARQVYHHLKTMHQEQFESAAKELEFRKSILNKFNENATQVEYKIKGQDIEAAFERSNGDLNRKY